MGRDNSLPGLHEDRLHTAWDPTSRTLPARSSFEGSTSPPDRGTVVMVWTRGLTYLLPLALAAESNSICLTFHCRS